MENQKIYEKELRKLLLRFLNFKKKGEKNFNKQLKIARKSADKASSDLLTKNIKTIAKKLNKKKFVAIFEYDEMVEYIRDLDHKLSLIHI